MPVPQGVTTVAILIFFIFAATMTAVFAVIFLLGLFTDAVRLESHWGGLGGGVGGWTMSRPLASLISALGFGLITALLVGGTFANSSERLKEKYQPATRLLELQGGRISRFYVQNRKLILTASVPDETVKNRVFDEIKLINPAQDDIAADISTPPQAKSK